MYVVLRECASAADKGQEKVMWGQFWHRRAVREEDVFAALGQGVGTARIVRPNRKWWHPVISHPLWIITG